MKKLNVLVISLAISIFYTSCSKEELLATEEFANESYAPIKGRGNGKNGKNDPPIDTINTQIIPWGIQRVGYSNYNGSNRIWIIDGGIDGSHPDLNVDRSASKSFVDRNPLIDDSGHGTQIAGIAAAKDNNIGVAGTAAGAPLVSVKIFGNSGGGLQPMIDGINYIKKRAKTGDVVIIAWTIGGVYLDLDNEITSIANKGVYFCIAAGNSSMDATLYSPQRIIHPNVYVISAFGTGDIFWGRSNFGNPVNVSQPGVGIYTTNKGNSYITVSGTSYSAPHLAGNILSNNGILKISGYINNDPDGISDPILVK